MQNKVEKTPKHPTSKLPETIDVDVDGSSSCFYSEGKKCQLIRFNHFLLFKYLIVWKAASSIEHTLFKHCLNTMFILMSCSLSCKHLYFPQHKNPTLAAEDGFDNYREKTRAV